MVLEQLIDRKIVLRHVPFVFVLSAVYVLVAYAAQSLFFPGQSLATVLLLTILLVPSLHHVIIIEEKIERTGASRFWKKHRTIIKCYIGAFLGILAGFLVLGFANAQTLEYQITQLKQDHLNPTAIENFAGKYFPEIKTAIAVFSHNVKYLLIGFLLSIFYGAGAAFLIVYNASLFAAFAIELFARWAPALQMAGISLLHLLPESAGFIMTAIAGATISRAITHEQISGDAFRNVLRNCFILLVLSLALIFLAALVETYVTAPFFHKVI
jgi:uncharacterized membrane protein SpoIIM required for sporulation